MQSKSQAQDFNFDWLFKLEDDSEFSQPTYDDSAWRMLNLPHDWSVEFPFDEGKGDGATGYLPGGIAWYRKKFAVKQDDEQLIFVLFDGIYNNAEIWCNGQSIGCNPYGYSPFWFDLTPYLNHETDEQILAVRVDHSRHVDSRWYTGSGIYRDVQLITKSRLHIPIWGTRLLTPEVSTDNAQITLEVTVKNDFSDTKAGILKTVILNPVGEEVAQVETTFSLDTQNEATLTQSIAVSNPELWHPDHPHMYKAMSYLSSNDDLHEVYETPFGIREFYFDPNEGFFLNGENMLIKGVCLHHDAGLVGAAVPDGVWQRRLRILKDAGCNAIRTAHNPASAAFWNLCDTMGFLVQEEFFDEWDNPKDKRLNKNDRHDDYHSRGYTEHFQKWAESDLKRTMLRDRNHPCIIQWSIGNEIEWTYPRYEKATGYFDAEADGNYFWTLPPYSPEEIKARFADLPEDDYILAKTAKKLADWTREMDTSRPVIANCILPSASNVSDYADTLDIVGYSYRQVIYDRGHAAFPNKPIMGAENLGQWHEWKHVIERPFISGIFIWTGINYLGESHNKFPTKATASGLLDLAGFPQPSYYMYKSLWTDAPYIEMTTQRMEKSPYHLTDNGDVEEDTIGAWQRRLWFWHETNEHWNYTEGELITIEIFSNCDEVELLLNGESLGRQNMQAQDDRIIKWIIPFAAGTLEARAYHKNGQTTVTHIKTASEPLAIQLVADKTTLTADSYDVAHIVAQLVDEHGVAVKHVERDISFAVKGACTILGVDNGASDSIQPYQSNRVRTSQGRALLIVQSSSQIVDTTISATSGELDSNKVMIHLVE